MKDTMCGLLKETAGPGPFTYHTDLPIPQINDDEILIKVHCTAICKTDIHMIEWDKWSQIWVKPPFIPGHETAGDVIAVGKNVTNVKVGDRVSCETHIPCGKCYFCRHGLSHICKNVKLFGASENGAFAEYAKTRGDSVYVLNDSISYEAACLFEPMGAGVHGVEAADVKDKNVLVSGCGPIGLTAVSASKTFGAKKVIACDIVADRLQTALDMGADFVINSKEQNLPEAVRGFTDDIGADVAIDITGAGISIVNSIKSVRAAGRVVCVGLPTKSVELDLTNDIIYREVELTGIAGRKIWETWDDFAKVMSGPYFKVDKVMGHKFALKDFKKAFAEIDHGIPGK